MKYRAFNIGLFPARRINRALQTEFEEAEVWVSKACHAHIAQDHADDYDLIMRHIGEIVRDPHFAGQDHRHGRNIYVIRTIQSDGRLDQVLVAIGLEISPRGTYNVRSAYTVKAQLIERRRQLGTLKIILPE